MSKAAKVIVPLLKILALAIGAGCGDGVTSTTTLTLTSTQIPHPLQRPVRSKAISHAVRVARLYNSITTRSAVR